MSRQLEVAKAKWKGFIKLYKDNGTEIMADKNTHLLEMQTVLQDIYKSKLFMDIPTFVYILKINLTDLNKVLSVSEFVEDAIVCIDNLAKEDKHITMKKKKK